MFIMHLAYTVTFSITWPVFLQAVVTILFWRYTLFKNYKFLT